MSDDTAPRPVPGGFVIGRATPVKQRVLGVAMLAVLLAITVGFVEIRHLDTVRDEVGISTSVDAVRSGVPADQVSNCFQGFCFEDDVSVAERGWRFATTYLRLVGWTLAVALVAVAIVDVLIAPDRGSGDRIAPLPATTIIAVLVLFSPLVAGVRIAIGVTVWLLLRTIGDRSDPPEDREGGPTSIGSGLAAVGSAVVRLAVRLVPWFVVAAFVAGFGAQILTFEVVDSLVGDHLLGIALAIVIGLLIGLPALLEIPLVAAALLLGMGSIPAAVLLFTAGVDGPIRMRRLLVGSRRVAMTTGAVVVLVALLGGSLALGAATFIESATVPTITFDGVSCSYSGPDRMAPVVHEFTIVNDTEDGDDGHTLAVVVGRLPENVSLEHFAATVAADPRAPLPEWFTVAGNQEFIFPGTEQVTEITLHDPGSYASVCLNGGSYYVIFEFSMPQPMGWFDEFRSAFNGFVADRTFQVAG